MNRKKNKINMLPSVGTPPVEAATEFVIELLKQERMNKVLNKGKVNSIYLNVKS